MREGLIAELVKRELGVEARGVQPLVGGQVGHVFRVETDGPAYVVKFVGAWPERPFTEEDRDNRVYGSRWSNLKLAYESMTRNGIAVARLHASGTLADEGLHFAILDYLDGEADDYSDGWFAALGSALGALHRITRPFQGWVAMERPYAESWAAAFAASFRSRLAEAAPLIGEELAARIGGGMEAMLAALTEPAAFVLSHTDGFQGVFGKAGGRWASLGVIDIEDHQFTDQRFVLAGLELSHAWHGRTVPAAFWESYSAFVAVAPDRETHRRVFQLYYLLVWARVLRGDAGAFAQCLGQLERVAGS